MSNHHECFKIIQTANALLAQVPAAMTCEYSTWLKQYINMLHFIWAQALIIPRRDTVHAGSECVEMFDFCMATCHQVFKYLTIQFIKNTGHRIKARTNIHAKELGKSSSSPVSTNNWPLASCFLIPAKYLVQKCAISALE